MFPETSLGAVGSKELFPNPHTLSWGEDESQMFFVEVSSSRRLHSRDINEHITL